MATLYSKSTTVTNSNFNWNGATDNYAWTFSPSATGTPNQLVLRILSVTGTPTADFYIRNQNTASGATTYASATGITLSAGTNTITLTGGSQINSGTTYYLWMGRTSNASNIPTIYFSNSSPLYNIYRSTSANADPTTLWQAGDISMDINGDLPSTTKNLAALGVG